MNPSSHHQAHHTPHKHHACHHDSLSNSNDRLENTTATKPIRVTYTGYALALLWSLLCLACYFIFTPNATNERPQATLNQWIPSASKQINEVRELARHLANNYQTVELLADPTDLNHHLSQHWLQLIKATPFIERIGVMEYERGEIFYVSNPTLLSQHENDWASDSYPAVDIDKSSDMMINYWMQAQLIARNDVLFSSFFKHQSNTLDNGFFRFTAPVYYNELRLGLVYVDLSLSALMHQVSNELDTTGINLIMLNKEGYYLAQNAIDTANSTTTSALPYFEESIGYYYPEFWRAMNSGLTGHFQTLSESAYFSKLDIPWYEDHIEYFYILQISDRPVAERNNQYPSMLIILWIIGGLLILLAAIRKQKHEYQQAM